MDRLEELSNTLSNITMYDIKNMYNQAKNAVLNISEMEAKVREATNDEPWGASSTLMQEIAQGTFNFQQFNEIMPCIYGRFMDKEARQWRQIYKALQLLEYLIKHGSERVVDDARSHISTLKMLRSFHYIDEKGKDEGINVRNRAKELVELLSDVEKIRAERRKAKVNRNKYVGVGNDGRFGGMSFNSGGSRYGGFGSDSLAGNSYGNDYYASSSPRTGGFQDSSSRRQWEEYDAGGDEISGSGYEASSVGPSHVRPLPGRQSSVSSPVTATPPPPPLPVQNLLDFDDDDVTPVNVPAPAPAPAPVATRQGLAMNKALPKPIGLDDDDFDDFQAAPQVVAVASPARASLPASPLPQREDKLMQLLGNAVPLSPTTTAVKPAVGGVRTGGMQMGGTNHAIAPAPMRAMKTTSSGSSGGFDDLWKLSMGSVGSEKAATGDGRQGKSMKELQREKAAAGLWGAGTQPAGGGGDDLLL